MRSNSERSLKSVCARVGARKHQRKLVKLASSEWQIHVGNPSVERHFEVVSEHFRKLLRTCNLLKPFIYLPKQVITSIDLSNGHLTP